MATVTCQHCGKDVEVLFIVPSKPPKLSEFEKFAYAYIRKLCSFSGTDEQLAGVYEWTLKNMLASWQVCRERFLTKCETKKTVYFDRGMLREIAAELDADAKEQNNV